ncbi:hypothetical protein H0E87_020438, partial [Populus deltoides]
EAVSASSTIPSTIPSTVSSLDPRLLQSLQYAVASSSSLMPASQQPVPASQTSMMPFPNTQFPQVAPLVKQLGQVVHPEPSLQSSPAREEGEVPESELDPDTRRRLLILQHGQDSRDNAPSESPFPARPSAPVSAAPVQSRGSWVPVEEGMTPRQLNRTPREFPLDSDPMNIERHQTHHPSFFPKVESNIPSDRMIHENQRLPKEAPYRNDRMRLNHSTPNYHSFQVEETPLSRSSSNRDLDLESERAFTIAETPVEVLQEIAMKCETKVEFRLALVASIDLQFSIEAWFAGEKVGEGTGKTRREAQRQAAEGSIKKLAGIYMLRSKPDSGPMHGDSSRYPSANDNGFLGNMNLFGNQPLPKDELVAYSAASEPSRLLDPRLEGSKKSSGSVTALKEFVEIDGQVLGKGIGSTWDEAKMQAAEKALGSLRTVFGQYTQKRKGSPRPTQGMPNKRLKQEFPRVLQRMPSSARYHKNAPPLLLSLLAARQNAQKTCASRRARATKTRSLLGSRCCHCPGRSQ